jgi:hypothetical protein
MRKREGKASFREQKEAKKLIILGPCRFSAPGPKEQSFCAAFFQKAVTIP